MTQSASTSEFGTVQHSRRSCSAVFTRIGVATLVQTPTVPLMWLAGMSYLSFCVFEIGRKIRAPADEEEGVDTYSALWGRRSAVFAWLLAMAGAGAFAALAARHVGAWRVAAGLAAAGIAVAAAVGTRFLADARPKRGRWFFAMSGVWLVVMYLALGVGAWMRLS